MSKQQYFMYFGLSLCTLSLFTVIVRCVRAGYWVPPVVSVLLASPVLLVMLAVCLERRRFGDVVDFGTNSWSWLIGDNLALTSAVAFAAIAWRSIPREGWIVSWWWTITSALIGLGAGVAFHLWGGSYASVGAGNRLLSPTKIAHDFVSYPVLLGALVCIGIPLLFRWSWHTEVVLACIGIWLVLMIIDNIRPLDVYQMHIGWDPVRFEPIPDPPRPE